MINKSIIFMNGLIMKIRKPKLRAQNYNNSKVSAVVVAAAHFPVTTVIINKCKTIIVNNNTLNKKLIKNKKF